jgi:hypothetical protein
MLNETVLTIDVDYTVTALLLEPESVYGNDHICA